jgi:1-aminocyclopropane-1-carboxylate deaminase/D-cysteine desulfhydrase-like pyridoxal-dependent ACC family enzyme
MGSFLEHTPIEVYRVSGTNVFVKREDLYGSPPAPPLGKLRGLRAVIAARYRDGARLVGCWDTRVSRLGEGLAAIATDFPGLRTIVGYPVKQGERLPSSVAAAHCLGAEILPLRGNVTPICYAQARRRIESQGGYMLPFGLDCEAAVQAVAAEAAGTPERLLKGGTLVLCAGSGVTLSGLLRGLPVQPRRIVALSSGRAIRTLRACVQRHCGSVPKHVSLRKAGLPYYAVPNARAPFPTHPNYDLKAWALLTKEIVSYRSPVLFWNIGA